NGSTIAGSVSLSEDHLIAAFQSQGALAPLTVYQVVVSNIFDIAGNSLAEAASSYFETSTEPDCIGRQVVGFSPSGLGAPVNSVVTVAFSEPVDGSTVDERSLRVINQTTGEEVVGARSVDASGRVGFFKPALPLAVGTRHEIVVSTAVQDLAGNPLSTFYGYFTTGFAPDTIAPVVVGTDPADGDGEVPINARLTVEMSEAVDPISVSSVAVDLRQGGVAVAGVLSLEEGNRRIRLVPSSALVSLTNYVLRLSGLRDGAGNPMELPVE